MILVFSSASGKATFSTGMGDKFHAEGSMPSSTALLRSMSYTAMQRKEDTVWVSNGTINGTGADTGGITLSSRYVQCSVFSVQRSKGCVMCANPAMLPAHYL